MPRALSRPCAAFPRSPTTRNRNALSARFPQQYFSYFMYFVFALAERKYEIQIEYRSTMLPQAELHVNR